MQQDVLESFAEKIRSTGISLLDKNLGGGLPSGSVVYLHADAKSVAEVFLYQFAQTRKSYYFTSGRRPLYVSRDIERLGLKTHNFIYTDIYSKYYFTLHREMVDIVRNESMDIKIMEFTEYNLKKILEEEEEDINIIFDSFSFYLNLNINPGTIKKLFNVIYEVTKNLNCLSFLYGIKDTHEKKLENEILKSCDVVFDIDIDKTSDRILNKLFIPKMKSKIPAEEIIKFKVSNGIRIDTTQSIT